MKWIQSHRKEIHFFCREFQNHLISVFWDLLRHPSLVFLYDNRYSCTFQGLDTIGSRESSKEQFWSCFVMRPRKMIQNNTNLSRCISSFLFQSDVDIKHRWRRTWGREQILKGFLITQILTRNFQRNFERNHLSSQIQKWPGHGDYATQFSSKRLWSNYWHFLSERKPKKFYPLALPGPHPPENT